MNIEPHELRTRPHRYAKRCGRVAVTSIEPLEARIAPAATFTYFDIDGDDVTITTSKGTNAELAGVLNFSHPDSGAHRQLKLIDLSLDSDFAGTNLTITAKRNPGRGGDGLVNVGRIDAADDGGDVEDTALNLGTVTVEGDLGAIDCGTNTAGVPALKSLNVRSMGVYGLATQGGAGDLKSAILGSLGKLTVAGDFRGVLIHLEAGANGTLGSATIGGSLIGGATASSGQIFAEGDLGPVKVKGDVIGGGSSGSGAIGANGKLGAVTIGGSLIGGAGGNSGWIFSGLAGAGDMGAVKIGGSVQGGAGAESGFIDCGGKLASVTIGGSLIGGSSAAASNSGQIFSAIDMGAVKIAHDVQGGGGAFSGQIFSNGTLARLTIGGSLVGGIGSHSDPSEDNGQVFSRGDMGAVKVGKNVQGGQGDDSGTITTLGKLASVTIGGSILGGGGFASGGVDAEGTGAVKIGGDLRGGSAFASGTLFLGNLASLTIGGSLIGGTGDATGFVTAFVIGPVKIAGSIIGGEPTQAASITGAIQGQRIASLFVGGSIVAGTPAPGDSVLYSGAVNARFDLGPVIVKGSIVGNDLQKVFILAGGQPNPGATTDVAIKSLTVGGKVEWTDILAGYRIPPDLPFLAPEGVNGHAQIGAVSIGGDWIASNLVAGVQDDGDAARDAFFGDGDDVAIFDAASPIFSKIARITIKGQALGTNGGTDHFAFIAEHIGSFSVAGTKFPFQSGAVNDTSGFNAGITFDLSVLEVTD